MVYERPFSRRLGQLSPYLTTSDDRLIEYGFQEILFDDKSPFQSVQIVKTEDHGNMLLLDGAVNLAEYDTKSYTHCLMNLPHVSLLGNSHLKKLIKVPRQIKWKSPKLENPETLEIYH